MKTFAIPLLIATASSLAVASSLCPLNNTPKCCTVDPSGLFPSGCVEPIIAFAFLILDT
ncbi:hypothetical protein RIB2604_02503370 [Aspergillus luchuensis]|uniref:Hydrophobin n=1 Tax=Aspergillus kawachii TaxID=1069201 RepID=A0A146FSN7_ASPKA|nr:hypothetical protein RIB2604_02503370 [Aspergillus luchuensis]